MPSGERIRQFSAANRWFLTALLSTAIASGGSAQNASFPGAKSETKSPDGRYTIRNTDDESWTITTYIFQRSVGSVAMRSSAKLPGMATWTLKGSPRSMSTKSVQGSGLIAEESICAAGQLTGHWCVSF